MKAAKISDQDSKVQLSYPTAFGALIVGGVIMGFSPVFVREAEVGAFASAFWRVLFALPILAFWAFYETRKHTHKFKLKLSKSAVLAGLFFAGDLSFWHLSILNTTMANATFLTGLAPVWVILFSNLILKEKPPQNAFVGIIICIFGMTLLINASLQIDPTRLIGDLYGIITSLFLGFYVIAIRSDTKDTNNGSLFFVSTIVTTLTLYLVTISFGQTFLPETERGWAALASLGILTHAGGQGLLTLAIAALTAAFSSLVIFIEAITAALFGWLFFDEEMDAIQLAGCFLILVGIWVSRPTQG